MSLPYLQGYYPAPEKTGLLRYDRQQSLKGANLFTSCHGPYAAVMDMKGNVAHEWTADLSKLWPGVRIEKPCWEMIYLYPNGDLLGVVEHQGVVKLDKDSNVLWKHDCDCHHDIDVAEDGRIFVLDQDLRVLHEGIQIFDHAVLILNPQGERLKRISYWDLFAKGNSPQTQYALKRLAAMAKNGREDLFHANTLQILDGSQTLKGDMFRKGNLLTCMLTMSSIMTINPETEEIEWFLPPLIWQQGQHFPILLENGNILIFDNHYDGKELSRSFEFSPLTRDIVWEYTDQDFYSNTHGTNQRLLNGNTLITESDRGRVFEVTPDKTIVWEYVNPHRTGEQQELIATIQIMQRINPADYKNWLRL